MEVVQIRCLSASCVEALGALSIPVNEQHTSSDTTHINNHLNDDGGHIHTADAGTNHNHITTGAYELNAVAQRSLARALCGLLPGHALGRSLCTIGPSTGASTPSPSFSDGIISHQSRSPQTPPLSISPGGGTNSGILTSAIAAEKKDSFIRKGVRKRENEYDGTREQERDFAIFENVLAVPMCSPPNRLLDRDILTEGQWFLKSPPEGDEICYELRHAASLDFSLISGFHIHTLGQNFLSRCCGLAYLHNVEPMLSKLSCIHKDCLFKCLELPPSVISFFGLEVSELVSVGDNFFSKSALGYSACVCLVNDTLTIAWPKCETVGSSFFEEFSYLHKICVNLPQLVFIGNNFFRNCHALREISLQRCEKLLHFGENFLDGCSAVETVKFPPELPNVSSLNKGFLCQCSSLVNISLNGLKGVTRIDDFFLMGCKSLRSFEFDDSLTQVSFIGRSFMKGCESILSLNLGSFAKLSHIGEGFLEGCSSMAVLSFPQDLSEVKTLPSKFLCGLSSLEVIDLTCFRNVVEIGDEFMFQCKSLQYLNLSQFAGKTRRVGSRFLASCTSLKSLDLHPLSLLTHIASSFLRGCTGLKECDLSFVSSANSVETIGDNFLSFCMGLEELDLRPLSNIEAVGEGFLNGCSNIKRLDCSAMTSLTVVPKRFLSEMRALEQVVLPPLRGVTSVSDEFLCSAQKLMSIDLKPLSSVTYIGSCFLYGCLALRTIDLRPLNNVLKVGRFFLASCVRLRQVNLNPLAGLTYIAPCFLYSCDALQEVDLSALMNVEHLGEQPLGECMVLERIRLVRGEQDSWEAMLPEGVEIDWR